MARATTSRGASSPAGWTSRRNSRPEASVIRAPSPRRASERSRRPRGCSRAVGWNWTYSRLSRRAPARRAIAMPSPRAPCGIGRVEIDLAEAARRQDRLAGELRRDGARLPGKQVGADHRRLAVPVGGKGRVVGKGQQVHGRRCQLPRDRGVAPAGFQERLLDRHPGFVLDVEHARERVPALERPVEVAGLAIERNLQLVDEERAHEVGSLAGEQVHRLRVAQAVPRPEDVGDEPLRGVSGRPAHDPSLRPKGVRGFGLRRAGDDRHPRAVARRRDPGRASRDARAKDEDVGDLVSHPRTARGRRPRPVPSASAHRPTHSPRPPARRRARSRG